VHFPRLPACCPNLEKNFQKFTCAVNFNRIPNQSTNMTALNITESRLRHRFHDGVEDYHELLAPLEELSENSSTLLPGYAASQPGWNKREDLVPYYHVLGKSAETDPTRILLAAGWLGTEEIATYSLLRLIAVLERRFQLVDGIEATIYPILNLEARKTGEEKTPKQLLSRFVLWRESDIRPVRVIERELWRYDYDLAVNISEAPNASEFSIHMWGHSTAQNSLLENLAGKHNRNTPGYEWQIQSHAGPFPPRLTPVAERKSQPIEVLVKIPGQLVADQQAEETVGILLFLMHEIREAHQSKRI
jgi:hypothetical protein